MESPPEGGADGSSKKRAAFRQLTKDDDPDAEEETNPITGTTTFKRASDEVLASRRIVKVRRAAPTTPTTNPFASISLVPPSGLSQKLEAPSATPDKEVPSQKLETPSATPDMEVPSADDKKENLSGENEIQKSDKEDLLTGKNLKSQATDSVEAEEKGGIVDSEDSEDTITGKLEPTPKVEDAATNGGTNVNQPGENGVSGLKETNSSAELSMGKAEGSGDSVLSFQQHSASRNAFSASFGTGFSRSSFSFGVTPLPFASPVGFGPFGSSSSLSSGSFGSSLTTASGPPSFFGRSVNDTETAGHRLGSQDEIPQPANFGQQFQPTISLPEVTVETGEEKEKTVFTADATLFEFIDKAWKERGKGELKVNLPEDALSKARLVMRSRGNLRLLLNANLFPDMRLNRMDSKGVTFACANSASTVNVGGLTTYAVKLKDPLMLDNFIGVVEAHKGSSERHIEKSLLGAPKENESLKEDSKESTVVEAADENDSNV